MESLRLQPVDPHYGDKLIWDTSVDLAYHYNQLHDGIQAQLKLLDPLLLQHEAEEEHNQSPEQAQGRTDRRAQSIELIQMRMHAMLDSQRSLAHIIGVGIGEGGLVAQSPYFDYQQKVPTTEATDAVSPGVYMVGGEVRSIDS